MPKRMLMTWVPSQKRWIKKIPVGLPNAGSTVAVGRRTLEKEFRSLVASWTQAGSMDAANLWWEQREAELRSDVTQFDVAEESRRQLVLEIIDAHLPSEAERERQQILRERLAEISAELGTIETARAAKTAIPVARLARPLPRSPQADQSIAGTIALFMQTRRNKHKDGKLSADRVSSIRRDLDNFAACIGGDTPIEAVNETTIEEYYEYCRTDSVSENTKHDRMTTVRQFITWAYENGSWERELRNIRSKDLMFQKEQSTPNPITRKEAATILAALPVAEAKKHRGCDKKMIRQLRLAVLLRLNCGMENIDLAKLTVGQIDSAKRTLTYKRNKTKKYAKIEPVEYPLWKQTMEALQEFVADKGRDDLVFLSREGRPMIEKTLRDDDKQSKIDKFSLNFKRFRETYCPQIEKPFKALRKTGATILDELDFPQWSDRYLQHAKNSVKSRHYSNPKEGFETAIIALGKALSLNA